MISILVDHNLTGRAMLLWGTLAAEGWLEMLPLKFVLFRDIGLPVDSCDREVWQFAQEHEMILFTDNRNMKGQNSLEQTIREEATDRSLPVITVGNAERLMDSLYREQCVIRIMEILIDLPNYLGTSRLFVP